MSQAKTHRPVKTLSPEVARKIAAGEVIDRPNAIVRELLDNAVDSGADSINVEISGGGISQIRISDNGSGMTKEDLKNCARPHATSKIEQASDLMNLSTLGFRGEALASIAAVSRLTIASGTWKMSASITEDHLLEQTAPVQNGKGTIVTSEGLFENFPARRVFLKRPASENLMCRETFVEKALARPDISFRLTVDGQLRLNLPQTENIIERFCDALELKESPQLFSLLKQSGSNWSFELVIGEPSVYRNDRKNIFVYVNGRRVQEYSLLQAIEYGCQGFFPNGTHPVAAVFVRMDPSQVDFNIHPAKKEVRFKDSAELHHGISSTVTGHFRALGIKSSRDEENLQKQLLQEEKVSGFNFDSVPEITIKEKPRSTFGASFSGPGISGGFGTSGTGSSGGFGTSGTGSLRSKFFDYEKTPQPKSLSSLVESALSFGRPVISAPENTQKTEPPEYTGQAGQAGQVEQFNKKDSDGFIFLGTALDCFLLAQVDDTIYFIDQHAAHERILFDNLMAGPCETQSLLIPFEIQTEKEDEQRLIESLPLLKQHGFEGKSLGDGRFEFYTVPSRCTSTQQELEEAIIKNMESPEKILYSVLAMTACKAAIKDGNILDRDAASSLAKKALTLTDPHCPHGRPVWTVLTKEQLFARVRRTR
ncbi:MAG: DNA mismatch repair endonuclease MutL [Treponema sp.]|nr:DNA mismatch repair endonuclease MutL [Treponema sp.]